MTPAPATPAAPSPIALEDAEVLEHVGHPGGQYVLRLRSPRVAERARPGQFVHLAVGEGIPMRRPLSLMRVDAGAGWLELLYKAVGVGTAALSRRRPGERLSLLGPIGQPFSASPDRPRALLLGGGVGIPPMIFLAEHLRSRGAEGFAPLVLMGSEAPFPFAVRPAGAPVPGLPEAASGALALLEGWGVPSRLASRAGYPGCHRGLVTDLARGWLASLSAEARAEVAIFACGPHPMLEAVARLARELALPCQISLEEYMACAVGGCAGCVVRVETPDGPAMKRVCVDGPVFDARAVFPA